MLKYDDVLWAKRAMRVCIMQQAMSGGRVDFQASWKKMSDAERVMWIELGRMLYDKYRADNAARDSGAKNDDNPKKRGWWITSWIL